MLDLNFSMNHPLLRNSNLRIAHAVNNWKKLNQAISNNIQICESDITWGKLIGQSQEGAICAHPPFTESDLSLELLLKECQKRQLSVKLDFKDRRTIVPALLILRQLSFPSTRLIINADVIAGVSMEDPQVELTDLKQVREILPHCVCSIGFLKGAMEEESELPQLVQEVQRSAQILGGPMTLALPVKWAWDYQEEIKKLNNVLHFTLWGSLEEQRSELTVEALRKVFPNCLLDLGNIFAALPLSGKT